MRAEKRIFGEPWPGEEPDSVEIKTWDDFLASPWVHAYVRRNDFKGWYVETIPGPRLSEWKNTGKLPYPFDDGDSYQLIVGERNGMVLGYLRVPTPEEYDTFIATVPPENRQ